jgi:hypothetical protein
MQPVGVHPNLKTEVGKLTETGADSLDAQPGWRRTTDGAPLSATTLAIGSPHEIDMSSIQEPETCSHACVSAAPRHEEGVG